MRSVVRQWRVAPLLTQMRCASGPAADEVLRAIKTLGATEGTPFADLKKKYISLAKQHHPDVQGDKGSSNHNTMSSINEAFDVISRAHKTGSLPTPRPYSSSTHTQRPPPGDQGPAYGYDDGYQPMWDDMPSEFYEAMWEDMQRSSQRDRRGRGRGGRRQTQWVDDDDFDGSTHAEPKAAPHNSNHNQSSSTTKTTTWSDTDLQALNNMYQDGRSFEFIGNALGKTKDEALQEFNRWCNDQKKSTKPHHNNRQNNQNRRRGPRGRAANMYSVGYDDWMDNFYDPEAFDESGEPLEVHVFHDIGEDMDMHPFNGQHSMYRGGGGRGRGGGRGNNYRGNKPRYQR